MLTLLTSVISLFLAITTLGFSVAVTPISSSPSVSLTWDANPNSNILGYNVYYGYPIDSNLEVAVFTNAFFAGNVTNANVYNLTPDSIYGFGVTAIDTTNNESPFSNLAFYKVTAYPTNNPPNIIYITNSINVTNWFSFTNTIIQVIPAYVTNQLNLTNQITVTNNIYYRTNIITRVINVPVYKTNYISKTITQTNIVFQTNWVSPPIPIHIPTPVNPGPSTNLLNNYLPNAVNCQNKQLSEEEVMKMIQN
jgi:hypothetical protein